MTFEKEPTQEEIDRANRLVTLIDAEISALSRVLDEKRNNFDFMKGNFEQFEMIGLEEQNKVGALDREKRMIMIPKFEELPKYGHVMSLDTFIDCVKSGGFIDYDGSGLYVRDGKESNIAIYPSDVSHDAIRKDFDTIIWFNR